MTVQMVPWELYTTKTKALDALAYREESHNWKPAPPDLDVVTRDGEGTPKGPSPHFFIVDEVDNITCLEISDQEAFWECEYERVNEQLQPIIDLLTECNRDRILIDCAQLEYLDHCSINVLFRLAKTVSLVNGRFALCNINPRLLEVMRALRLPLRLASEHQW